MNSEKSYNLLDENIYSTHYGLLMLQGLATTEFIDTKVKQLIEAGIMDYWISKSYKLTEHNKDSGPEVLTLEQLEMGFLIWLTMLGITSLCFVVEFLINKIKLHIEQIIVHQIRSV